MKAQSAMEYLMTYGWAILIIVIVMAAIFSLGLFKTSSITGTTCKVNSNFLCSDPLYSQGNLILTIGQTSASTWGGISFYLKGSNGNVVKGIPTSNALTLGTGEITKVTFNIAGITQPASLFATYNIIDAGSTLTNLNSTIATVIFPQSSVTTGNPPKTTTTSILITTTSTSSSSTSTSSTSTISTSTTSTSTTIQPTPTGIINYVSVSITNTQTSNTPTSFQQMIDITENTYVNYIAFNNNFANFEYFYSNGTVIPAWIESNQSGKLTTWIKLTKSIAANSNTVVYLGFAPKTTNLLSNTGTAGMGEAPQLSTTYAQYDNGVSVFNFYDNFAGTTLSNNWVNNIANAGGTLTINNGMSYIRPTSPTGSSNFMHTSATFSKGVYETYGTIPGGGLAGSYTFSLFGTNHTGIGDLNGQYGLVTGNNGLYIIITGFSGGLYIWSIIVPSSTPTSISATQNYGSLITSTVDIGPFPENIRFLDQANTNINIGPFYWVRTRSYPPKGVMPSVSFGSVK